MYRDDFAAIRIRVSIISRVERRIAGLSRSLLKLLK